MMDSTKRSAPEEAAKGLVCRSCGCRHFRVLYTRRVWGGRLLRRRTCRHCERRITTYEQTAATV